MHSSEQISQLPGARLTRPFCSTLAPHPLQNPYQPACDIQSRLLGSQLLAIALMSQLHADEPVCQKLLFYAMIFSLFPILLATQKATRAPKMWEVQTLVHGYLTTCVCALRDCACAPIFLSACLHTTWIYVLLTTSVLPHAPPLYSAILSCSIHAHVAWHTWVYQSRPTPRKRKRKKTTTTRQTEWTLNDQGACQHSFGARDDVTCKIACMYAHLLLSGYKAPYPRNDSHVYSICYNTTLA